MKRWMTAGEALRTGTVVKQGTRQVRIVAVVPSSDPEMIKVTYSDRTTEEVLKYTSWLKADQDFKRSEGPVNIWKQIHKVGSIGAARLG